MDQFTIIVHGLLFGYDQGVRLDLFKRIGFAEPDISADAKGHGTSAKAPWVVMFMPSRPLNSSFGAVKEVNCLNGC